MTDAELDETLDNLREIKSQYKASVSGIPGVTGFGIKLRNNEAPIFRINVLDDDVDVPDYIEGIPVEKVVK